MFSFTFDGMDTFSLHKFLPYRLNVVSKKVSKSLATIYTQYGFDRAQWRIISHLGEQNDPLYSKDIRNAVYLEKGIFSRALFRLEKSGYVKRKIDPADRRNHYLELTPEGRRIYDTVIPQVLSWHQDLEREIGTDTIESLLKILDHMDEKSKY